MANTRSNPSSFFCKFFIIVLVLLTIPLFPSQAPEFTAFSSFFTKLWEPLQLLFVGLAICYGLFCKRSSTKLEVKNEGSDLDFCGFLDMSSFFENGVQNSCGYDEKGMILESEEMYKLDEKRMILESGESCKLDENGSRITKGWNSKYFPGKSRVVVANVDEWGEPVSKREYKPLNLPVRSLRSNIVVFDKEAKCSLDAPLKIRGVRPMNLEMKFDEVSSPAPGSWQGRSCMVEMKDGTRRNGESSRLRPHSAGEFDFDRLELESSSLGDLSQPLMEMEDMDQDIDLKRANMKISVPRVASEGTFMASKSLQSSFGHSLDMTLRRSNKERIKETSRIQKEDDSNGGKKGGSYLGSEVKSDRISRVLSRGKSVRTIRSCKVVPYEMRGSNPDGSNAGEVHSQNKDSSLLNQRCHENPEAQKKLTIGDNYPVPVLDMPESQSDDKDDSFETSSITSRDDSESESESYSSSSDEEVAQSDTEGSEVDRKAGEFIARFREQIRLQNLHQPRDLVSQKLADKHRYN